MFLYTHAALLEGAATLAQSLGSVLANIQASSTEAAEYRSAVKMTVAALSWLSIAAETDAAKATKHLAVGCKLSPEDYSTG